MPSLFTHEETGSGKGSELAEVPQRGKLRTVIRAQIQALSPPFSVSAGPCPPGAAVYVQKAPAQPPPLLFSCRSSFFSTNSAGPCTSVHGHHTAAPQPLSIQRPAVARDPPPLRTPASPAAALPSASGPINPGPVFPSPAENQNAPGAAESLSGKAGSLKCGISMKTSSLSFLISWESCLLTSADRSSNG